MSSIETVLRAASALVASGRRGVLATALDASASVSLLDAEGGLLAGAQVPSDVAAAAARVDASGSPEVVDAGEATWFLEPSTPAPRLVVLGAVSVADALVPMGIAAGFDVTVIDTREWLARSERYPGAAAVICGEPAESLRSVGIDSASAVVSFLHEARLEDQVLIDALRGPARYVGSMGSGKTTAAKRERLAAAGLAEEEIARLHAPIGLDIGSSTPEEIAVSVLAEIVATRRGRA